MHTEATERQHALRRDDIRREELEDALRQEDARRARQQQALREQERQRQSESRHEDQRGRNLDTVA